MENWFTVLPDRNRRAQFAKLLKVLTKERLKTCAQLLAVELHLPQHGGTTSVSSTFSSDTTECVLPTSNQFLNRFEIGVLLRDRAEGWIHFEAGKQVDLGRFRVAQKRVVTAHVVVINWLAQERDRPLEEKFLRLESFSQLVQTKTGMQKPSGAMRRDPAKLATDRECARPLSLAHQMMKPQLQNFRPIPLGFFNRI